MIRSTFINRIDKIFPSQKQNLLRAIFAYIDKNHEILKTANLTYRPSFSDTDREVIFDSMGISAAEMLAEIKKSDGIDHKRNISGNPFYIACALLAGYCLANKEEKVAIEIINYMSFNMYTSMHYKYVKFNANEAVMNYTVSQLNNSFDLKREGTLLNLIVANTKTVLNTYNKMLSKGDDESLGYFVNAVNTRLNSKVKKIFQNYYKHKESGKYLNLETESMIPEEYKVMESDYHVISALADKVFLNFVNNRIHKDVLKFSVVGTEVSEAKFKSLLQDLRNMEQDKEIRIFIINMISYAVYYNQMPVSYISTGKYLSIMKAGYTSNTNSKEMEEIKKLLDFWVSENANKYGRTSYGKTAANGYKKAIYNFFMYTIYTEAK